MSKPVIPFAVGSLLLLACTSEFPLSWAKDAGMQPDAAQDDSGPSDAAPSDARPPDGEVSDAAVDAQTPGCGNGVIEGGEGCDDDNLAANDGCSPTCTVEPGWSCTGSPRSTCTPICGDGEVHGDEECDDDNLVETDGCTNDCRVGCTNGSTSDCNPAGQTRVGTSAFVDPEPPAGFVQCAGFENTDANDVDGDWEANCLGEAQVLRVRYWSTATNPWTLWADATLDPTSLGTWVPQTFGATNHAGAQGIRTTSGLYLMKDPVGSNPVSDLVCDSGPANRHHAATDLYLANQANNRELMVCGFSEGDVTGPCRDSRELAWVQGTFGICGSAIETTQLAIAIYLEI